MTPGTYVQVARGFAGTYIVWVTVSEPQITNITWDGLNDSAGLGAAVVPLFGEKILEAQTTGVDSISGTSVTSAGFKAAVQAKTDRADATVIVIEKQELIGGTTKTSAGVVYAALDDSQAEADALADYYMERAQGYADRTLVQFFAENSYETIGFLGITGDGMASGTFSAARMCMSVGGDGLVQFLYEKAAEPGVTVLTSVKAAELITNPTGGAETGVKAESKTINYTLIVFTVAKAVPYLHIYYSLYHCIMLNRLSGRYLCFSLKVSLEEYHSGESGAENRYAAC
jgi:fumarate reductase flavoprotein subunit